MNLIRKNHSRYERNWILVLSCIIALITFPRLNPVYANGIDPPLAWVFNYLIQGRLLLGKDIIFPHGPLAFLMYPLTIGLNLWIAIGFHLLIRFVFVYGLLRFRAFDNKSGLIILIIFAFILLAFLDLLLIMIGLVVLGYLIWLKTKKLGWLLGSFLLTVIALYVKAFVGIVCGIVTLSFFIVLLVEIVRRTLRPGLLFLSFIPVLLLPSFWFLMFGSLNGLPRYLYGMLQLAGDNSAAVSYYPENNWVSLFLVFCFFTFLVWRHYRDAFNFKYFILILPALFAVWKYGMAREDYLHSGMYFLFIMIVVFILNLIVDKHRVITFIAGFFIVILSYFNLQNALFFETLDVSFSGLYNLTAVTSNYKYIKDTCIVRSEINTRRNRLDPDILGMIGTRTTDIYPWDYSYIPVNRLKWQPRPVLQSYACYTPWLDNENSKHFSSARAPQFLIWELRKITHDIHNGTLESIDGRYLLNDQPKTVVSILSNYQLIKKQGGRFPVWIFRKRETSLIPEIHSISRANYSWNQWLDVPLDLNGILRVNAIIERNFTGNIKSFLYKDEACYVYYLLTTGEIRVYRIVPKNAAEGIWVNPLIINGENSFVEPGVKKIMFRCSNPDRMKPEITVTWQIIKFSRPGVKEQLSILDVNSMFGKTDFRSGEYLLKTTNTLESRYPGWSKNPLPDITLRPHSGKTSCKLTGGEYSFSYEMLLDSVLQVDKGSRWMIKADMWAFSKSKINANFVLSIESEDTPVIWKAVKINDFIIDRNEWNYVYNFIEITDEIFQSNKSLRLKVYAWNPGTQAFNIDDMRVMISQY